MAVIAQRTANVESAFGEVVITGTELHLMNRLAGRAFAGHANQPAGVDLTKQHRGRAAHQLDALQQPRVERAGLRRGGGAVAQAIKEFGHVAEAAYEYLVVAVR